jgi:hypothetical protein
MPQTATNSMSDYSTIRAGVWIPVFRMGSVVAFVPTRRPRHVWDHYQAEQTRS